MENLLGLNMRINCFGDKVSSLHCKIVLLDEQQLVHEVLHSKFATVPLLWHDVLSEGKGADVPHCVLSGEIDRNNDVFTKRMQSRLGASTVRRKLFIVITKHSESGPPVCWSFEGTMASNVLNTYAQERSFVVVVVMVLLDKSIRDDRR
ncbi:hypothetical protein OUZ56_008124 [Daphnia magna]|uniref:Uncharacterized protein n=1 Tax=Daphnia magna TaxID=35525 RepID=A0ABR0AC08_9CRUS|nr:hypothetical protein OUZ56_008124 [Daphnia magna]